MDELTPSKELEAKLREVRSVLVEIADEYCLDNGRDEQFTDLHLRPLLTDALAEGFERGARAARRQDEEVAESAGCRTGEVIETSGDVMAGFNAAMLRIYKGIQALSPPSASAPVPGKEPAEWREPPLCEHCGYAIKIRNPSGYCDHLYYPDMCKICEKRIESEG